MKFKITKKSIKPQLNQKMVARRRRLAAETGMERVASGPCSNKLLPDMKLALRPIANLKIAKRKVRKAEAHHVENVMKSLKAVGQCVPIIIDGEDRIINGHVVAEALKRLGAIEIWCVVLEDLTEGEAEFLQVSLNKLSDGSEWVLEDLKPLLVDLGEFGFDLSATGFSPPELDMIMLPDLPQACNEEVRAEIDPEAEPVSELGDLWEFDEKHRLLCGDSTKAESYKAVLANERAAAVFTDCPWNLPKEVISNFGKKKHGDFKMGAGEMSAEQFATFCNTFNQHCADNMMEGAVMFSCIDWRSDSQIIASGEKAGLRHINTIVWNKGNGGFGGLYRAAHELIPTFCKGKVPRVNNVKLGKHGRDRTNVWNYPGANRSGSSANKAVRHHPTPKPVEMVMDALLDVTDRGELILDPFLGSGTTLLAADRCGRRACGIELDPRYVDLCVRRWEEETGLEVVHAETGQTFREVAEQRLGGGEELEAAE